jgi:hypothetical protein
MHIPVTYIHTCTYIHIYIYVHTCYLERNRHPTSRPEECTHIGYIYIDTNQLHRLYTHTHIYMYIHIHISMYIYIHICIYLFERAEQTSSESAGGMYTNCALNRDRILFSRTLLMLPFPVVPINYKYKYMYIYIYIQYIDIDIWFIYIYTYIYIYIYIHIHIYIS